MAKEQAAKPSSSSGGKAKKKKWSKGKVKEKSDNVVVLDKTIKDKLMKEVPTYKLVTVGVLMDRLRINGAVARRALLDLEAKGLIKKVSTSAHLQIYTRATAAVEEAPAVKA